VLTAIDLPLDYALGTLRLSVGRATTPEDIHKASALIKQEINKQLSQRNK
jgi:cysteine sulfinate desulfinase/cysteine desulfurase-like protein